MNISLVVHPCEEHDFVLWMNSEKQSETASSSNGPIMLWQIFGISWAEWSLTYCRYF